jgi:hypothetical protein
MGLDHNFYQKHFGNQFLKEKPGTAEEFEVNIPGLDVDESLKIRVVKIWNHMFEHDVDISAVIMGDQLLCKGKMSHYDNLVKKIDDNKYELGLDKNANFYLIFEGEIVEE